MFESLRHWIESIDEDSKLFRNADDEMLHSALASLLYHFISREQHHDEREKHEFSRLMKDEFELSAEQIEHLYQSAKSATGELRGDLLIIKAHLKGNPGVRMQFMQRLLQLINIHGAHSSELELFYRTLHEVFPEVRDAGGSENF